jgi:ubiquinone/menaquinone biosynthesis C-methylase UbiE
MRVASHKDLVNRQFGAVADEYLKSAVHAQGADLEWVVDRLRGKSTAVVLDLGCGAGHLSFAIAPYVHTVTAYDLSSEMLEVVAREAQVRQFDNIKTQHGVAEELPFPDAHFDCVCTRYSAHHWADLARALIEMRRVLKVTGQLMIIDVLAPPSALLDTHLQTLELLRDPSHVRNYSVDEWRRRLSAAGFTSGLSRVWKLRLEFGAWVSRMRTPAARVAVLRSLIAGAPREVRDYLCVEADDSFQIDAGLIEAAAQAP